MALPGGGLPLIYAISDAALFVLKGGREFTASMVLSNGLAIEKESDAIALLGIASNL
jgi:hypothetical protein